MSSRDRMAPHYGYGGCQLADYVIPLEEKGDA